MKTNAKNNGLFLSKFSTVVFVALLANIIVLPTISYLSIRPVRITVNVIEYGFCLLSIIYLISKFITKDSYIGKSMLILFCFVIYAFVISLIFSKKTLETLSLFAKICECFCFFSFAKCEINTQKRLKTLFIVIILTISIMFATSIVLSLRNPKNLIEAFTGGKYRLGNSENQANGYALYCFYLCVTFIIIYFCTFKKLYLVLTVIPTFICVGTQSKKGILICFVVLLFAIYLFVRRFKSKKIRVAFYILVPCIIAAVITIVGLKTNILNRFLKIGDSTITRFNMFKCLFADFDISLLVGKGMGSFSDFFYLNAGTRLVFHSTIGDTIFSYGLIGLSIWVAFIFNVFYKKNWRGNGILTAFIIILVICQLLNDFTATVWYIPFVFIIFAIINDEKAFFLISLRNNVNNELIREHNLNVQYAKNR